MLETLELFGVAQHFAFRQRYIGMAALVTNGIHVVVNAHDSNVAAFNSKLANLTRCNVGERTNFDGTHALLPNFAITLARMPSINSDFGSRSMTSSKNPNTTKRSAISGGTPRLSK